MFTGFGQRGVRSETVAAAVATQARAYLKAEVPVWEYLADQRLLPLALVGGGSFLTGPLSPHAQTQLQIIQRFLDVAISTRTENGKRWMVRVG